MLCGPAVSRGGTAIAEGRHFPRIAQMTSLTGASCMGTDVSSVSGKESCDLELSVTLLPAGVTFSE